MNTSKLKKNLILAFSLSLMGFLSYMVIYFTYRGLLFRGNSWMNIITLTLIYVYGKRIGSFFFLIGGVISFFSINNLCCFLGQYFPKFYPTEIYNVGFQLMIFGDILLFFYFTLIYKKMIDHWNIKKIFRYFMTNSFLIPTYYLILFMIISLFGTPDQSISVENMLVPEHPFNILLRFAMLGFKSMIVNVCLLIDSSFSTLLIPLFTMQSPLDQRFTKIDALNVTASTWHKIIFIILVFITGSCYYFEHLFLTMLFMSYTVAFTFLFFLIGREIFFKSMDKLTNNNIILTIVLFRLIIAIMPMLLYFWIIIGAIEAYLKIWNPDRDKYLE